MLTFVMIFVGIVVTLIVVIPIIGTKRLDKNWIYIRCKTTNQVRDGVFVFSNKIYEQIAKISGSSVLKSVRNKSVKSETIAYLKSAKAKLEEFRDQSTFPETTSLLSVYITEMERLIEFCNIYVCRDDAILMLHDKDIDYEKDVVCFNDGQSTPNYYRPVKKDPVYPPANSILNCEVCGCDTQNAKCKWTSGCYDEFTKTHSTLLGKTCMKCGHYWYEKPFKDSNKEGNNNVTESLQVQ